MLLRSAALDAAASSAEAVCPRGYRGDRSAPGSDGGGELAEPTDTGKAAARPVSGFPDVWLLVEDRPRA